MFIENRMIAYVLLALLVDHQEEEFKKIYQPIHELNK